MIGIGLIAGALIAGIFLYRAIKISIPVDALDDSHPDNLIRIKQYNLLTTPEAGKATPEAGRELKNEEK